MRIHRKYRSNRNQQYDHTIIIIIECIETDAVGDCCLDKYIAATA